MPAYTHLQQAQPILLAHYWLSFFFALEREKSRIKHALTTADSCPLGAGAVAGSGFTVDRAQIARDLGFGNAAPNSIDAVASRDFLLEALAAIASTGILCSRYAEDLIIWSSTGVRFHRNRRRMVERIEHDAAEKKPRLPRTHPREKRPFHRQLYALRGHAERGRSRLL